MGSKSAWGEAMKRILGNKAPVIAGLACALAFGLLAASAGGGQFRANSPAAGKTLTVGLAEDPDALDPTLARTFVGRMVFMHMCEKLYDIDAHLNIVPQLAAAM